VPEKGEQHSSQPKKTDTALLVRHALERQFTTDNLKQKTYFPTMGDSKMKAVHYEGPFKVSVKEIDLPKIQHPDDVIIKVTTSCICGEY